MTRKVIDKLIQWKKAGGIEPILLTGAKGVGKTYLVYDFAKAFFEHIYYLNFQCDPRKKGLFVPGQEKETEERLKQYFGIGEEESRDAGVLILDEINYAGEALEGLQIIQLRETFPYIICISSSPVKDLEDLRELPVSPLEFDEFLGATGNEWYIDLIRTHYNNNTKLPDIVHKELLGLYHQYVEIGGMPGSINEFLSMASTVNVSEQHRIAIGAFRDRIIKDYCEADAFKMLQVMDSMSHQLIKENKKFQYRLIRKGTTHSMYKEAIKQLGEINYAIKCNRISQESLDKANETSDYKDIFQDEINSGFKLYLMDTGLLHTKIIQENEQLSKQSTARALLENYMAQVLHANQYPFAFWESDSIAKIDFIIYKDNNLIPIEIFTDQNTRSKSLSVFKQKYDYPYAIKVSAKNFEYSGNIKYVPIYAVFCI